jgi:hypothetical protein
VHRPVRRVLAALIAVFAVLAAATACGGDDAAVTVTERITVGTDGVPLAAPDAPAGDDLDAAAVAYREFFGFTEEQARCVVDRARALPEFDPEDPSALITAAGLQIFQDCGVDLAEFAGRFGGQP